MVLCAWRLHLQRWCCLVASGRRHRFDKASSHCRMLRGCCLPQGLPRCRGSQPHNKHELWAQANIIRVASSRPSSMISLWFHYVGLEFVIHCSRHHDIIFHSYSYNIIYLLNDLYSSAELLKPCGCGMCGMCPERLNTYQADIAHALS
jgi:hypothetical protein